MSINDSMSPVIELGRRLAREWERHDCAPETFAALASAALCESNVLSSLSLEAIGEWALFSPELPNQKLRDFGQPPINLYAGRGFFIEALVWIDSPTTIHQHGFSGAFGVLKGSSFHSEYSFDPSKRINDQLVLGEIKHRSSEVLRQGDVRTIRPGSGFIHSLVHLEPPSVSLVVRTPRTMAGGPQYNYLLPGLAVDPFHKPEPLETQLELLRAILTTDPQRFESLATRLIRTRDLWTAFKIADLASNSSDETLFDNLAAVIAERAPDLGDALLATHNVSLEHRELIWLFKQVGGRKVRYLLAALLSGASSAVLRDGINHEFGRDAIGQIVSILEELSPVAHANAPLTKIHLRIFELAMRGVPYETMRENWLERFASDGGQGAAFERAWSEIHSSAFLGSLLTSVAS
jgi:hypothetical protein